MDVDEEVNAFIQDVDFFSDFFLRNSKFVAKGAEFTSVMAQSLNSLRGVGNVNLAKTLFFEGTITLQVTKRYLEAIMMFELWNSLLSCQKHSSDESSECARLKSIVRNNSSIREGLFRMDAECLSVPRGETCASEWNRARGTLNNRMTAMISRFDRIIRRNLRQYLSERPAVSPQSFHATTYNRSDFVRAISEVQKTLLLEINQQNKNLLSKLSGIMSSELMAKFNETTSQDRERILAIESSMKTSLSSAQEAVNQLPLASEREREDALFGSPDDRMSNTEDRLAALESKIDLRDIEAQLKSVFQKVDELTTQLQEHQRNLADILDEMIVVLNGKMERLEGNVDQKLDLLETRLVESEGATRARLLTLEASDKDTRRWKHQIMALLSSIMLLSIFAVLCEALKVPVYNPQSFT